MPRDQARELDQTGAQLVVQSADGISDVRMLARILSENLGKQDTVRVESIERLLARGGDAFGFEFTVAEETRGRGRIRQGAGARAQSSSIRLVTLVLRSLAAVAAPTTITTPT